MYPSALHLHVCMHFIACATRMAAALYVLHRSSGGNFARLPAAVCSFGTIMVFPDAKCDVSVWALGLEIIGESFYGMFLVFSYRVLSSTAMLLVCVNAIRSVSFIMQDSAYA